MNKIKLSVFAGVMLGLVGCASVGGMAQKYVSNDKVEGIIYGAGLDHDNSTSNQICAAIKNKDDRCLHPELYQVVAVAAKFGFADAFVGTIAFAPVTMDIGQACVTGSLKCTYFKTMVDKNKLGTVLEVASRPGDGKCQWSGLPRAGGTVCTAYNWDYRKDGQAAIPR